MLTPSWHQIPPLDFQREIINTRDLLNIYDIFMMNYATSRCLQYVMASVTHVIVAALFTTVQCSILIDVPHLVRLGQDDLEITCKPAQSNNIVSISYIRIFSDRTTSLGDEKSKIARVLSRNGSTVLQKVWWTDKRYIIKGNISNRENAYLKIKVVAHEVQCNDMAQYRCEMMAQYKGSENREYFMDGRVNVTDEKKNISTIEVSGPQSLTATPYGSYNPGTLLHLSCNATTGNDAGRIKWCIQEGNGGKLKEMYNNVSTMITVMNMCTIRQHSTLRFLLQQTGIFTWIVCTLGSCNDKENSKFVAVYTTDNKLQHNSERPQSAYEKKILIVGISMAIVGVLSLVTAMSIFIISKHMKGTNHTDSEQKAEQPSSASGEGSSYADIDIRTQYDTVNFSNSPQEESPYTALQTSSNGAYSFEDENCTKT